MPSQTWLLVLPLGAYMMARVGLPLRSCACHMVLSPRPICCQMRRLMKGDRLHLADMASSTSIQHSRGCSRMVFCPRETNPATKQMCHMTACLPQASPSGEAEVLVMTSTPDKHAVDHCPLLQDKPLARGKKHSINFLPISMTDRAQCCASLLTCCRTGRTTPAGQLFW